MSRGKTRVCSSYSVITEVRYLNTVCTSIILIIIMKCIYSYVTEFAACRETSTTVILQKQLLLSRRKEKPDEAL